MKNRKKTSEWMNEWINEGEKAIQQQKTEIKKLKERNKNLNEWEKQKQREKSNKQEWNTLCRGRQAEIKHLIL